MEHVSDEQYIPPSVVENLGIHIKRRGIDNNDVEVIQHINHQIYSKYNHHYKMQLLNMRKIRIFLFTFPPPKISKFFPKYRKFTYFQILGIFSISGKIVKFPVFWKKIPYIYRILFYKLWKFLSELLAIAFFPCLLAIFFLSFSICSLFTPFLTNVTYVVLKRANSLFFASVLNKRQNLNKQHPKKNM